MVYENEILITKEMVDAFGQATGDLNPIHFDEDYAKTTMFKGTIVHGMLTAGLISASLTDHYGLGTIYIDQTLHFKAPVRIGDTVQITFTNEECFPRNRVMLFVKASIVNRLEVQGIGFHDEHILVLEGHAFIIKGKHDNSR